MPYEFRRWPSILKLALLFSSTNAKLLSILSLLVLNASQMRTYFLNYIIFFLVCQKVCWNRVLESCVGIVVKLYKFLLDHCHPRTHVGTHVGKIVYLQFLF